MCQPPLHDDDFAPFKLSTSNSILHRRTNMDCEQYSDILMNFREISLGLHTVLPSALRMLALRIF